MNTKCYNLTTLNIFKNFCSCGFPLNTQRSLYNLSVSIHLETRLHHWPTHAAHAQVTTYMTKIKASFWRQFSLANPEVCVGVSRALWRCKVKIPELWSGIWYDAAWEVNGSIDTLHPNYPEHTGASQRGCRAQHHAHTSLLRAGSCILIYRWTAGRRVQRGYRKSTRSRGKDFNDCLWGWSIQWWCRRGKQIKDTIYMLLSALKTASTQEHWRSGCLQNEQTHIKMEEPRAKSLRKLTALNGLAHCSDIKITN